MIRLPIRVPEAATWALALSLALPAVVAAKAQEPQAKSARQDYGASVGSVGSQEGGLPIRGDDAGTAGRLGKGASPYRPEGAGNFSQS